MESMADLLARHTSAVADHGDHSELVDTELERRRETQPTPPGASLGASPLTAAGDGY